MIRNGRSSEWAAELETEGHSDYTSLFGTRKSPAGAGLSFEAAEGIRTLDLLHGKRST
jgi:hypothetical protein